MPTAAARYVPVMGAVPKPVVRGISILNDGTEVKLTFVLVRNLLDHTTARTQKRLELCTVKIA